MSLKNVVRINRVRVKKELKDKYGIGWSNKDLKELLDEEDYKKYIHYILMSRLYTS